MFSRWFHRAATTYGSPLIHTLRIKTGTRGLTPPSPSATPLNNHTCDGIGVFGIAELTVCTYLHGIRCPRRQTVDRNRGLGARDHQRRPCSGRCAAGPYRSVAQFVGFCSTNRLNRSQQLAGRTLVDAQDRRLVQRLRGSASAGSRLEATGKELCSYHPCS